MRRQGESDRITLVTSALQQASHLLPFAGLLQADHQLQSIILSLIQELPTTAETASTLAELFPDPECLKQETSEQLCRILLEWQDLLLPDCFHVDKDDQNFDNGGKREPHGGTLAAVYYDKIRDHERQLEKKRQTFGAYHNKLFTTGSVSTEELLIGSRSFDSHYDFLVFLDTFYSVSFGSCIESEGTGLPLIDSFSDAVRREQLEGLRSKVTTKPEFSFRSARIEKTPTKKSDRIEDAVSSLEKSASSKHGHICRRSTSEADLNMSEKSPAVVLSQPVRPDVPTHKGGLGPSYSARSCGTATEVEHMNTNNSGVQQSSPEPSGKTRPAVTICSGFKNDRIKPSFVDLLSESVLPPATVERLKFEGQMAETKRVGEWLSGWAARHHVGDSQTRSAAIRIRVSPQFLAYSLWLIDSCHRHFVPHVDDITVGMVHDSPLPRDGSSALAGNNSSSTSRGSTGSLRTDGTNSSSVASHGAKKDRRGLRKQKSVCHDGSEVEVTTAVNHQTWSLEEPYALSPQQLSCESGNRSADNDADRFCAYSPSFFSFPCLFLIFYFCSHFLFVFFNFYSDNLTTMLQSASNDPITLLVHTAH